MRARSLPPPVVTNKRRLTFCRQFIRAVFSWPTKQPLVKLTPLSSSGVAFEPEQVAELGAAFAHAEAQPVLEPALCGLIRRPEPAIAEIGKPRVGYAFAAFARPVHAERRIAFDGNGTAQSVDGQPFDKVIRSVVFAVEQEVVAVGPDEEIEQALALRREQPGPHRQRSRHIARDQALEEAADVLARQANDGAIGQGGAGHVP